MSGYPISQVPVDLNQSPGASLSAMDLDGLRVAITGAAHGTGRLLAETFTDRGAQVFLAARDVVAARRVADAINQQGAGRAEAFHSDLAAPDSVRGFAAAVTD